jgi:hypothetical protein
MPASRRGRRRRGTGSCRSDPSRPTRRSGGARPGEPVRAGTLAVEGTIVFPAGDRRRVQTLWFNAWKYPIQDTVLAGLLGELLGRGKEEPGPKRASYGNEVGDPTPVDAYPKGATPEGVFDLAGNVWEWCRDGQRVYDGEPKNDPTGPDGGSRVLRGRSFFELPEYPAPGAGSERHARTTRGRSQDLRKNRKGGPTKTPHPRALVRWSRSRRTGVGPRADVGCLARWFDRDLHTHVALDDAISQGTLFCNMLAAHMAGEGSSR